MSKHREDSAMGFYRYNETASQHFSEDAQRRLAINEQLMMVVIDFFDGPQNAPDPFHTHPHEQTCYVAQGEVIFFLGDEQAHLSAGDMVSIPSELPHSIQRLTEHVRLVDSFTPIREDFLP
ncbi:MAG: cupin domain-containing protein [Anaerolineae bacterium]|nr:cupin domain-containing protein [Anaerolineae bacterium]